MGFNTDEDADPRRQWRLVGVAGLLLIPFTLIWWPGCREYPAVTSKDSMHLMKLLYAACNTKDPARLARVEQGLEKATRERKLSPPEQKAFARIVGLARGGRWEEAERAAFKFAQDQVGRGHPEPDDAHEHRAVSGKPRPGQPR